MTGSTPIAAPESGRSADTGTKLIVILAVVLLLAQVLPLLNTRWVEDESWYASSAHSLAKFGELRVRVFAPPGLQSRFDAHPPLPVLAMAGLFKLFGTNLYTARIPFLLAAIAGILLTYLLGCELGGRRLGALGAVFLAVDNLYFIAARSVRPEPMVVACSVAGLLVFLISQRRRSTALALLSGVLIGAGLLAHPNGFAAALTAGVLALLEFGVTVVRRARPWAFVAGVALALAPFLLFVMSSPVRRSEFIAEYTYGQGHPLSDIPALELSRYKDFIGMPSGRFHMPVPLPYRLHVVLALLAAVYILYRYNRPLLGKLACFILPCMVWWAYERFETPRYMATASPYLSLLLAGGVTTLIAHRPAWRKRVLVVAMLLAAAEAAGNYAFLYLYRKADYVDLGHKLEAIIPKDATVYGALTFWMALNDHTYYSWNRAPLEYALDHGATYLILNDRVLLNGSGFGKDDWRNIREALHGYVRQNASLVGRVPNPFYGDLEIYKVNGMPRAR